MRRIVVVPALLLLAACQPQPPRTAAPAPQGSLGLPEPEATHRYDKAVAPVDETRAPRRIAAVPGPPAAGAPPALSEREKRAIAAWEQEEAANRATLTVRPPPLTRSKLGLPDDAGPLPVPSLYHPPTDTPASGEPAVPPPAAERPQRPKTAAPPAPPPRPAPAAVPPPAPPPSGPPPPAPPAPVQQAAPPPPPPQAAPARTAAATAAPAEPVLRPPPGSPLTTVLFTPRSAELSDGARIALGFFAQDPKTRRLRRIELWACSSAEDPADAGKIALARALAVHAFLIDLGFKGNIEIGGYAETAGDSADRVDVMVR
jgi:hypothetical protein